MPSVKCAPTDGIHELSVTNWNRGAFIAELKRQMSGNDTASPRNPKRFPIHRCRSGRLLGMKSIRMAPTSGVNKIVLKMCLSEKSIHSLAFYIMYGVMRHIKVVPKKTDQADYD